MKQALKTTPFLVTYLTVSQNLFLMKPKCQINAEEGKGPTI
jgi:hypothetical protein